MVETYVSSMQCHIHTHKNLHTAMLTVWRKKNPPQETDVLAASKHKTEPNPQAILCSIKNFHIPKRK
jgi:hypothetical protein